MDITLIDVPLLLPNNETFMINYFIANKQTWRILKSTRCMNKLHKHEVLDIVQNEMMLAVCSML